ncbi:MULTISPECIES: hypothetical protein [unclassified Rhizobium]|uniref:hypothetical protein n=1 Tax=unclassified Rhizobium TaxID=2613769 RepID=UPI0007155167|nr:MULTISPECIES: hypothetical protein [unclassified Rhizobium]KQT03177.1 hypothetical protein ASG42_24515 [Rhizobium sp. Leaf391]KQU08428.1 hypothetical protein ASG68_22845 [Rhizobium sp. Leaf453]
MTDPLMELVSRYQKIERAYNEWPADDKVGLTTMEQAHSAVLEELATTTEHATMMEGAVTALRQAARECDDSCPNLAAPLIRGALAFFTGTSVDNGDSGDNADG